MVESPCGPSHLEVRELRIQVLSNCKPSIQAISHHNAVPEFKWCKDIDHKKKSFIYLFQNKNNLSVNSSWSGM